MFGLCCAYGMIMFNDNWNRKHRSLGVKMNLATALLMGLLLAARSEIPVAIGGPDLNPVVFIGGFMSTISEDIATQLELDYPEVSGRRRLLEEDYQQPFFDTSTGRCLGASSSSGAASAVEFCEGLHLEDHGPACNEYHDQLRATAVFTVTVSSAALGLLFFCLGRFRGTQYVSYVPTSVMEAFLSCVGYKVFKYALKFCKEDPKQFLPAALVGVTLYFTKAMHIGNPAIMIPTMLLVPLGAFYFYIFVIDGSDLTQARADELMFPHMDNIDFWRIWLDGLGNHDKINFKAWLKTGPDFAIMIIVVVLDCLLKISSTESKLPVKVNKDYEIKLHGIGNVATVACGSPVGYMQLKFNVINFGILGNTKDRRGGALYALLCGACFFTTIELFNYLPRFFLGTLLFFAGAGFVAENLWGSRKYLSFREWTQILVILAVFIITGELLQAVLVGGLLTGIDFILRYSKVSCVAGRPMRGGELPPCERCGEVLEKSLSHIANSWLLVIRLKGFIFFASAQSLTSYVREQIAAEVDVPEYRRLKFVVFDCQMLDAMDASASKALKKLVTEADELKIRILWSHITPEMGQELKSRTIVESLSDCFVDLERAVQHVHGMVLQYRVAMQKRWLAVHPAFQLHGDLAQCRMGFEPFQHTLLIDVTRFGSPWQYCGRMPIQARQLVLNTPGKEATCLMLVHTGAVGLFQDKQERWSHPVAIYRQGWFINREMLIGAASYYHIVALEDGEVLYWDESLWNQMRRERPLMASAIFSMVMKQQARDSDLLVRGLRAAYAEIDLKEEAIDLVEPYPSESEASTSPIADAMRLLRTGTPDMSPENSLQIPRTSRTSRTSRGRVSVVLQNARIFAEQALQDADGFNAEAIMPEEMYRRLVGIQAAQVLDAFQLYDSVSDAVDEEVVLPPLPAAFQRDLELSFAVYSQSTGGTAIPCSELPQALMYAGIFNTCLREGATTCERELTMSEFVAVGHRAAMAPLSCGQMKTIKDLFERFDKNNSASLDVQEMVKVFREIFHPQIAIEEVHGIAREWNRESAGKLCLADFISVMSRFIRIHEQDWCLMQGVRAIMGKPKNYSCSEDDSLTVEALVANSSIHLTHQEAEEMLWAADWRLTNMQEARSIPLSDFVAAVLLEIDMQPGELPPDPRRFANVARSPTDAQSFVSLVAPASANCVMAHDVADGDVEVQKQSNKASEAAGLVMDLRDRFAAERDSRMQEMGNRNTDELPHSLLGEVIDQVRLSTIRSSPSNLARQTNTFRARCHLLLEDPDSSRAANVLSLVMGLHIVVAVFLLFLEPLISPKSANPAQWEKNMWRGFEWYFTVAFTVEFIARLAVADALGTQTTKSFLLAPSNICDLVAVLPFYMELALQGVQDPTAFRFLRIARLMRLTRVMKIAKLARRGGIFGSVAMVLTVIWGIYLLSMS